MAGTDTNFKVFLGRRDVCVVCVFERMVNKAGNKRKKGSP